MGYGDGSTGYSVDAGSPADINTPFGLFPDVTMSDVFTNLATKTQEGITAFEAFLAAPPVTVEAATSGANFTELLSALSTDPTATFTDLVNAITTASSAAYSTLLPTASVVLSRLPTRS